MAHKIWNWLLKNWPHFTFEKEALIELEKQFTFNNGRVIGVLKHLDD